MEILVEIRIYILGLFFKFNVFIFIELCMVNVFLYFG